MILHGTSWNPSFEFRVDCLWFEIRPHLISFDWIEIRPVKSYRWIQLDFAGLARIPNWNKIRIQWKIDWIQVKCKANPDIMKDWSTLAMAPHSNLKKKTQKKKQKKGANQRPSWPRAESQTSGTAASAPVTAAAISSFIFHLEFRHHRTAPVEISSTWRSQSSNTTSILLNCYLTPPPSHSIFASSPTGERQWMLRKGRQLGEG